MQLPQLIGITFGAMGLIVLVVGMVLTEIQR